MDSKEQRFIENPDNFIDAEKELILGAIIRDGKMMTWMGGKDNEISIAFTKIMAAVMNHNLMLQVERKRKEAMERRIITPDGKKM